LIYGTMHRKATKGVAEGKELGGLLEKSEKQPVRAGEKGSKKNSGEGFVLQTDCHPMGIWGGGGIVSVINEGPGYGKAGTASPNRPTTDLK